MLYRPTLFDRATVCGKLILGGNPVLLFHLLYTIRTARAVIYVFPTIYLQFVFNTDFYISSLPPLLFVSTTQDQIIYFPPRLLHVDTKMRFLCLHGAIGNIDVGYGRHYDEHRY